MLFGGVSLSSRPAASADAQASAWAAASASREKAGDRQLGKQPQAAPCKDFVLY